MNHRVVYSVLFYILFIMLIIISKPRLVFDENGELRHFGIGSNKTMFSLGVFTVTLALVSFYMFALIDLVFGTK